MAAPHTVNTHTVVPAKAGTHNPPQMLLIKSRATSKEHVIWVPAFAGTTIESHLGVDLG
jgi:hypothetical protein